MAKRAFLFVYLILITGLIGTAAVQAQDNPLKPSVVMGDVVSISDGKIVVQTKDGSLDVIVSAATEFKRVPPDNPKLSAAVAAAIADIGVGDKLVISGIFPADRENLPARTVYLMTKADISQKQAHDSEKWRTRGITGRVQNVDPVAKEITVEMRGLMGSTSVKLTPKDSAKFLRYAPGSVKYSEAKPSSLIEIRNGDMIRALGDRSTDGTTFAAEEVVTGAFQTVAGTVKSVDTAKNEVVIENFQTKKDVTVSLSNASLLKRFPEEMAQRMAMAQGGGMRPGGQGQGNQQGARPQGERPQGERPNGAGAGGMGGGQRMNIDEMLDRFPTITAADLKAGDVIAVSSSKNGSDDHISAIKLLAGVEPFLRAAQAAAAMGGRGQQSQTGTFTIPGLDGFDGP